MKRVLSLISLLSLMVVLMASCSENSVTTDDTEYSSIDTETLYLDNTIAEENSLTTEATMDNEMQTVFEEPDMKFQPDRRPPKRGKFIPLGLVFRQMELTQEQMDSVHSYMRLQHECEWAIKREMFETIKPYMDSINQERRIILQAVKDEEMTREEAREALQALNLSAREYLREIRESYLEELKDCHQAFFDNVASILTDEQLEIWEDFLERLQERLG